MRAAALVTLFVLALAATPAQAGSPTIAAVFPVEDRQGVLKATDRDLVGDLVATKLVESGRFQVVPGASIKQRLQAGKRESYRDCYDQSCQIEIGRELAAQMALSTRLARVGQRCLIMLTLYDLKRATAARSTSEKTSCEVQAVVDAVNRAVPRLTPQPTSAPAAGSPGGGGLGMSGGISYVKIRQPPSTFDSHHFFHARAGLSLASSLVDTPAELDPGFGVGLEYGYEMRLIGRAVRMQFGLGALLQRWTGGRGALSDASALHVYGLGFFRIGGAVGRVDILGGLGFGYGYLSHEDRSLTPVEHTGGGIALTLDLMVQLHLSRHFAVNAFSVVGFCSDLGQTVGESDRVEPIPSLGATFGLGTTFFI